MVEISIICLIYRSSRLAEKFYRSLEEYTPMLKSGLAEFFFVANDPTKEVLDFLKKHKYPYILNKNKQLTNDELFKEGYAAPEYMRRVYQGYNEGIKHAKGNKIVLVNSDNFFSKDWLENLLKYLNHQTVICSTLVEPGHILHGVFPGAIEADFGRKIDEFQDDNFQQFANKIRKTGLKPDGAYMPCLMYKDIAILAGLYPLGNLADKSFDTVKEFGDIYFYQKLYSFGVRHYTSKDSIVYHLKEGEKDDKSSNQISLNIDTTFHYDYTLLPKPKVLSVDLKPTKLHDGILYSLLSSVCVIIYNYCTAEELQNQIRMFLNQTYDQIEIIVIENEYLQEEIKKNYINYVKFVNPKSTDYIYRITMTIFDCESAYILLSDPCFSYSNELLKIYMSNNYISQKVIGCDYMITTNDLKILFKNNNGLINAGTLLFPKNLLIQNSSQFLNAIVQNKDVLLDLTKFKGNYELCLLSEPLVFLPIKKTKYDYKQVNLYKRIISWKILRPIRITKSKIIARKK